MRIFLLLGLGCLCFASISVFAAGENDAINEEALRKTQELLNSPALLAIDAKENASSNEAQNKLKEILKLTGASEKDAYSLSDSVFSDIVSKTNGDPAAIQKILLEAQRDPAAFAKTWKPEDQAKLRELASQKK